VDGVVVLLKDLQMDEAALLADSPDDGDGGPPVLQHVQLHARYEPALRGLLPQVEGGLVHIHDLIICTLVDEGAEELHELKLFVLEAQVLGIALPEFVVGPLVLHPIAEVVLMQCLMSKPDQVEFIADELRTSPEAEVAHALQRVLAGNPLHLLGTEEPRAPIALGFFNDEASTLPPGNDVILAGELDASTIEHLRRPQPHPGI
jgi:hypothetical protein